VLHLSCQETRNEQQQNKTHRPYRKPKNAKTETVTNNKKSIRRRSTKTKAASKTQTNNTLIPA
jgi:hypothetical protein